jgi:hypothetical protein
VPLGEKRAGNILATVGEAIVTRPSKRRQQSERAHHAQGQEGPDDASNKEFALRTISLLAKTHEGNGLLAGEAVDDEEQLAAAFSFLQMQAAEYLNLQMEAHGPQAADHPRARVAAYAMKMIKDIIEETGHPVHRLFRGLNKRQPPGDVTSRNFTKQALLIACVEALLDTDEGIRSTHCCLGSRGRSRMAVPRTR